MFSSSSTKFALSELLKEYLNLRQPVWDAALSIRDQPSRYAIPELDEYPEYRSLVDKFDIYMKSIAVREARTDTEHLLEWLDNWCTESWVKNYDKFLLLAQAVAKRGYKTAIDVPPTEDEFYYRKYIREFDAWMQSNIHPDRTHLERLLTWLDKESKADDLTYQQFLTIARIAAKKGYKTMIDVPISEAEFSDFFLKKYREFANKLVNEYSAGSPQRIAFVSKFCQMANAADTDISSYKQSRRLATMLRMESESIKANYKFIDPARRNGSFFSVGSRLYSMIENLMGVTSLQVNETVKKYLLAEFHHFLTDNSSSILDKLQHLKNQSQMRMGIS